MAAVQLLEVQPPNTSESRLEEWVGTKTKVPLAASLRQVRAVAGEHAEVHAAIVANAKEQGWRTTKKGDVEVVAVTPVDSGGGMVTRDEWHFRIESGRVSAQLFLQSKEAGKWKSTSLVSEGYSYARENEQLDKIQAHLQEKPDAPVSE